MNFLRALKQQSDLTLVFAVVAILLVLFAPIPPALLDFLIIVNFALAMTMLFMTFYVERPVEFSTFPSLLLIATLFRLALNVAATRLILSGAEAGEVIGAIGTFAVQGSFAIGLVVFTILVVVQYVVVTSGAQRVSEVAARFVLDAMPGQQMSIDADLNMGLIDQDEAKRRRKELEREAGFYGSMDGASKFVKGDAIAGILIVLIDLVGGFAIGVAQMGMPWPQALQTFALLTVGDGIVTQIPALIISVATGILVTRSASDGRLSHEVARQLSSRPKILMLVGATLLLLLLLPGMPKWPMAVLAAVGGIVWWIGRKTPAATPEPVASQSDAHRQADPAAEVEVCMGAQLAEAWRPLHPTLTQRLAAFREQFARDMGVTLPAVGFRQDDRLEPYAYHVRLHGDRYGHAVMLPDKTLAVHAGAGENTLPGIKTSDPAFGLPALWIDNALVTTARNQGYTPVDPVTVFITHVSEVLRSNAARLLSRSILMVMLEGARARQPGLVEELVPQVLTVSDIQHVLHGLLEEGVAVRNLDVILEVLVDRGRVEKDPVRLGESVRQRLGHAICQRLVGDSDGLSVITLEPRLEQVLLERLETTALGGMGLPPTTAESLLAKMAMLAEAMLRKNLVPVLLCRAELRWPLRVFTRRSLPRLTVLSMQEVSAAVHLSSFGVVRLEPDALIASLAA